MGLINNSRVVAPVTGVLAFGSVTGSNVSVLDLAALNKRAAGLLVSSTLVGATSDIILSIGGVDVLQVGPSMPPLMLELGDIGSIPPGAVAVRHGGVAPTAGNIRVTAFPVR